MKATLLYYIIVLISVHSACSQKKDVVKDSLRILDGDELRRKVRAAVDAKVSFEKAEDFVGSKAMFPGTDSTGFWFNNLVALRVTGGDLPKGDMASDYKYLLRWDCKEIGENRLPIITGIFWDKDLKPFYYEGWIYPP